MTERWFAFTAYNSPAIYGYGTQVEADAYCDVLNRKRGVNGLYSASEIADADALASLDSGADTDGFRLDEALATIAENDYWLATQSSAGIRGKEEP